MITKVFALFDSKAGCFGTPFFMPNQAMAVRAFNDLATDGRSLVSKHPTDFILYEIGSFDDYTAGIDCPKPVSLGHPAVPERMAFSVNGPVNVTEVDKSLELSPQ